MYYPAVNDPADVIAPALEVSAGIKYQLSQIPVVDPRPYLVGSLAETFEKYPDIGSVLPAMGYSPQQIKDLEDTIKACDCDVVVSATPIDLTRLVKIEKPTLRVRYQYADNGDPTLAVLVKAGL